MPAPRRGGRRRRGGANGGHGPGDERWLITYADMLTLLLALFILLYSISSVNTSKFEALQTSLRDAFSGKIVGGGEGIVETGVSATKETPESVIPNIAPSTPVIADPRRNDAALEARREDDDFHRLKAQIEAFARAHGLERQVEAVVARRGLVVRLLTDKVLFDSGFAVLKPQAAPLLAHVGNLLKLERVREHPILVEGHTDDVPISTAQFASNWELSTARATEVVRHMIGRGVPARRFGASGYADLHPLSTNASNPGRARNRRVEIVLQRLHSPSLARPGAPETQEGQTP